MPYKVANIYIPEKYDKRRKLSTYQREEIDKKYSTGKFSLNELAKEYGVCKKTILLIVNPDSAENAKRYMKENYFQVTKEKRNEYMRRHRHRKQKLFLEGKLTDNIKKDEK